MGDMKEQFTATMQEVNGKMVPVIKIRAEEIRHPDGRVDVVIHAPALNLINKIGHQNT